MHAEFRNRMKTIMFTYYTHFSIGASALPLRSVTPFPYPFHLFLLQPRSPVLALSLHLNGIHLCQTFTMRCLSFPITSIYYSVFLHIFSIFRSQRCCWCLLLAGSSCLFICVLCSIAKIALHSFRHRPAELLSCFCYWLATVTELNRNYKAATTHTKTHTFHVHRSFANMFINTLSTHTHPHTMPCHSGKYVWVCKFVWLCIFTGAKTSTQNWRREKEWTAIERHINNRQYRNHGHIAASR